MLQLWRLAAVPYFKGWILQLFKSDATIKVTYCLVYLNGNNAAEGENNINYASSYPMNWTVKNWFVEDLKGHGYDTDEWHNVPF